MAKLVRFSETIKVHDINGERTVTTTTTIVFVGNAPPRPVYQCPYDIYSSIFQQHNSFIDQVRRFILERANHSPSLFIEDEKEDDDFWSDDDPQVKK